MDKKEINKLSNEIIGYAIEVHRILGPGLLESAYEECLCHELDLANIRYTRQEPLPVTYKGKKLDCGYRLDVVVEKSIILELKAVDAVLLIHEAQLLTYLKLSGISLGLLMNFNINIIKNGIRRIVNKF
jgi:GxxExxY protein